MSNPLPFLSRDPQNKHKASSISPHSSFETSNSYTDDDPELSKGSDMNISEYNSSNDSSFLLENLKDKKTPSIPETISTQSSSLEGRQSSCVDDSSSLSNRRGSDSSYWEKVTALKEKAITSLKADMKTYTVTLKDLLATYSIMRSKTPDGIRQHFDQAFEEIKVMIDLQNSINDIVETSNSDIRAIAQGFLANDFSIYKKYTVLANTIQKEMKNHSKYFQENFQDLATQIMVPSRRLNNYVMHFKCFQEIFCKQQQEFIEDAIKYLENLKDQANTEMTINVFQNCPVELRLAGLIRQTGDVYYEAGSAKKKMLPSQYLTIF